MIALERANEIRIERAGFKRDLKRAANPSERIAECENGISVYDALRSVRRVSATTAEKWMRELELSPRVTLGGERSANRIPISDRMREKLVALVKERRG